MTRIAPYSKRPPMQEVALLTDRGIIVDEHRVRHQPGKQPAHLKVYTSTEAANRLVDEGNGELLTWNTQPTKWRHAPGDEEWRDFDAYVLAVPFPDPTEETLRGLVRWRNWLYAHGAHPTSLAGSGYSLLRAKLTQPVWTMRGQPPPLDYIVVGGRQLTAPWRLPLREQPYGHMVHVDLFSAYPTELSKQPYNEATWRAIFLGPGNERTLELLVEMGKPLVVEAMVKVPELELGEGPLPRRPDQEFMRKLVRGHTAEFSKVLNGRAAAYYDTGCNVVGIWNWVELAEALEWGCTIELLGNAWQLQSTPGVYPFRPWYEALLKGRELPGLAGSLAKSSGNATWGRFAPSAGTRRVVRTVRGQLDMRRLPPLKGQMPESWDLAELIVSGVRAKGTRMMRQMGHRLVTFHTDGGWITPGPTPEGWRVKSKARKLEVIDEATLRAFPEDGRRPQIIYASVPNQVKQERWKEAWQLSMRAEEE